MDSSKLIIKMFRITMNYVHDKEEALDVMQDSFHKALNYFEKKRDRAF